MENVLSHYTLTNEVCTHRNSHRVSRRFKLSRVHVIEGKIKLMYGANPGEINFGSS